MITRLTAMAALLIAAPSVAADDARKLAVEPSQVVAIKSVSLYQTKNGKRESVGEFSTFDRPFVLPGAGPFEVLVKPKNGIAVRVIENLTVRGGETHELKLDDVLGSVQVLGDNFPRAKKVLITSVKDPGPGEKGHVALQVATDYRIEMAVPPGMYAVWVVPANGARAQRVADNVRVQAGRSVRVGD